MSKVIEKSMNQPLRLSFDIESFETSVYQGQVSKALVMLRELLGYCDSVQDIEGMILKNRSGQDVYLKGLEPISNAMLLSEKQLYLQRLATAISALFSSSSLTLEEGDVLLLLYCKDFLRCLFGSTSYRNMDHILLFRGIMNKNRSLSLKTDSDITWLLLCFTLESDIKIDFDYMLKEFPEHALYTFIGCLYSNRVNLTERSNQWLESFIKATENLPNQSFHSSLLDIISSPWMLCSYLDHPGRHKIKTALNGVISCWLAAKLSETVKARLGKNSSRLGPIKKVAIFSEKYTSTHAMYRCYHKFIASLKSAYEVTLVTLEGEYDQHSALDFDHVLAFQYKTADQSLLPMISRLAEEDFDAIYYPSLGMTTWAVVLSNLRIARHQMMSLGHPASSFSNQMDYLLPIGMNVSHEVMQPMVSEIIPPVLMDEQERVFTPHPELQRFTQDVLPTLIHPNDGILRIAVNSSIMKISKRFLEVCKIIEQNASIPLEFHFFPGVKAPFQHQFFETCLGDYVRRFKVHPNMTYLDYMKVLHQCDLAFGTFPFGGSNTNVDLSTLGIPKLVMNEASDIAGYTDDAVSSIVGHVGFIKCENEAGFMANAIYLIHDKNARNQLSQKMRDSAIEDTLIEKESDNQSRYLIDVLSHLESRDRENNKNLEPGSNAYCASESTN